MDILTVFAIMAAVCMAGVGCAFIGCMIMIWKLDKYDTERFTRLRGDS